MSWRSAAFLAAIMTAFVAGACTRISPASIDDFGAEKTLLVTLRDGETIKGHIDEGETVTFTTFGRVYRADVESLGDNGDILLGNIFVQEEYEHYDLQRLRMEGSTLHVQDETETVAIPAYRIVKVEEVSMDRMKSARAAGFWGWTIFVASQILNTRL
jgi:hypothetical protein